MHIHILGICGTFMGGIALLARQLGHTVTGADRNVYPPMSDLLASEGISVHEGYDPGSLESDPDRVIVGNALSRGIDVVEAVLDRGLPYTSGPQWLAEHVLQGRWVLAVAGTHGKTTTSAMLTWILESTGLRPGFLIGGVPENFGVSARAGESPFFVVEADEYDTAFFDKRSKFVHYRPRTAILNNLEFDHADIFPDLSAIQRQFHHLVRTVPGSGLIVRPTDDPAIEETLRLGCWTPQASFGPGGEWTASPERNDGSAFSVHLDSRAVGRVQWNLIGMHNVSNALAAVAAARHAGVPPASACEALGTFLNVKRRLQLRGTVGQIEVYDDFAHHPTAIRLTIDGLRRQAPDRRIVAILEPRSNTMRMGVHRDTLAGALADADAVLVYRPEEISWDIGAMMAGIGDKGRLFSSLDSLVDHAVSTASAGDRLLIMSNGGFGGIHQRVLKALRERLHPVAPSSV